MLLLRLWWNVEKRNRWMCVVKSSAENGWSCCQGALTVRSLLSISRCLFFSSWKPPRPGFSPCWGIHLIKSIYLYPGMTVLGGNLGRKSLSPVCVWTTVYRPYDVFAEAPLVKYDGELFLKNRPVQGRWVALNWHLENTLKLECQSFLPQWHLQLTESHHPFKMFQNTSAGKLSFVDMLVMFMCHVLAVCTCASAGGFIRMDSLRVTPQSLFSGSPHQWWGNDKVCHCSWDSCVLITNVLGRQNDLADAPSKERFFSGFSNQLSLTPLRNKKSKHRPGILASAFFSRGSKELFCSEEGTSQNVRPIFWSLVCLHVPFITCLTIDRNWKGVRKKNKT